MTRTLDEILAQFRATGSVTLLPASEVALLVQEVERLRARVEQLENVRGETREERSAREFYESR